ARRRPGPAAAPAAAGPAAARPALPRRVPARGAEPGRATGLPCQPLRRPPPHPAAATTVPAAALRGGVPPARGVRGDRAPGRRAGRGAGPAGPGRPRGGSAAARAARAPPRRRREVAGGAVATLINGRYELEELPLAR